MQPVEVVVDTLGAGWRVTLGSEVQPQHKSLSSALRAASELVGRNSSATLTIRAWGWLSNGSINDSYRHVEGASPYSVTSQHWLDTHVEDGNLEHRFVALKDGAQMALNDSLQDLRSDPAVQAPDAIIFVLGRQRP